MMMIVMMILDLIHPRAWSRLESPIAVRTVQHFFTITNGDDGHDADYDDNVDLRMLMMMMMMMMMMVMMMK